MATMPDSFFSWVVFLLNEYGATLLQGAGVTLLLALVGTFIGCVIGLAVGICQTIPEDPNGSSFKQALVKGLKAVLSSYVEIFRGTPMIVQAMVVYYGAMSLFDIDMSAMFAGFLVVSINTGAYMAETVRGGIESIDEASAKLPLHWHGPFPDYALCSFAAGSAQYYAADWQQPYHQYQGYFRIERYFRYRALFCF